LATNVTKVRQLKTQGMGAFLAVIVGPPGSECRRSGAEASSRSGAGKRKSHDRPDHCDGFYNHRRRLDHHQLRQVTLDRSFIMP
jgi:hypothetical protein